MAVTTRFVIDGSRPIKAVLLDEENEWQILCDTTRDPEDGMLVCMGCLFNKYPFLAKFADLKPDYEAFRENESSDWEISKIEWDEE